MTFDNSNILKGTVGEVERLTQDALDADETFESILKEKTQSKGTYIRE